jgi:hypothetical protein
MLEGGIKTVKDDEMVSIIQISGDEWDCGKVICGEGKERI